MPEDADSISSMEDADLGAGLNQALSPHVRIFSDRDTNSPLEKFLEAPPQAELEEILEFPLDEGRLKEFLAQEKAKRTSNQDDEQQSLPEKLGSCFLDVHKALSENREKEPRPEAKPPTPHHTPHPEPAQAQDTFQALLALTDAPEEPAPPGKDALTTTPAKPKSAPIVISPETASCQELSSHLSYMHKVFG